MRNEIDFLPTKHRAVCSRRQSLRWSLWAGITVVCAIVLTDVTLRYRLQGLCELRTQARQDSERLALTVTRIEQLDRAHYEVLEQLAAWSAPLGTHRATKALDTILVSRPEALTMRQVDWACGDPVLPGAKSPTLRISGVVEDLGAVISFVNTLDASGQLPKLVVKQSGVSPAIADQAAQTFVIESRLAGGPR